MYNFAPGPYYLYCNPKCEEIWTSGHPTGCHIDTLECTELDKPEMANTMEAPIMLPQCGR